MKNLPNNYIVFDLETSGLDHNKEKITEIGAMKVKRGEDGFVSIDQLEFFIRHDGLALSEKIIEITGITDKILREQGLKEELAVYKFMAFIEDLPLIGHNAIRFDKTFIQPMIERYVKKPIGDERFLDTAAIYKAKKSGYVPEPQDENHVWMMKAMNMRVQGLKYNLGDACKDLGIEVDTKSQHRALYDAEITMKLYEELKKEFNQE